jgi:hypothetical protein
MANLPLHQFTRLFRFFSDTVSLSNSAPRNHEISICKRSFDGSDVILTTLVKFRLQKNGSSQQGDNNRDETNDTTIETRRLCRF